MRRFLWLPFVVAVSVVPGFWPSAASGANVDTSNNGRAVSPAGPTLSGANGAKVGPLTPGRTELNAKRSERWRPCFVSLRSTRTTLQRTGWCGGR
jgi:hypothetical protein